MGRATRNGCRAALGLLFGLALGTCRPAEPARPGGSSPADPASAQGSRPPEPIAYLVGPAGGRWHEVRTNRDDSGLTDEERREIVALESIGYVDGLHDAPDLRGVTRCDVERASPGLNLYTSAHEAMSALTDMQGNVLHEWRFPFRKAWPDYPHRNKLATFWRRTFLYPNGDLLAIYEGLGIIKIDAQSNLLWQNGNRAHHDLQVMPDGSIWVLTREAHKVPHVSAKFPVLEDFITHLDAEGRELERISLLSAMEDTDFDVQWAQRKEQGGDLFHTNSLEVLDGSLAEVDPAFRAGNFLVSMLMTDMVAVVDRETQRVVWGHVGPHRRQHDPQVLANGRILVFDNQGADPSAGAEVSRILEMDPRTWEPVWSYAGRPSEPFYSETCGLAQRLENGNTLITETDYGRAFEVTSDGDIVWEFYNPHRSGDDGRFIATLMEVRRLPADFPSDWLGTESTRSILNRSEE